MFERLFGLLFRKRQLMRRDLAARITAILDRHGSLVLDARAVAALGAGYRETMLMACYLAFRERAHLLGDDGDRMVLVSNAEYQRRLAFCSQPPLVCQAGFDGGNFMVVRPRNELRRLSPRPRTMKVELTADTFAETARPESEAVTLVPLAVAGGSDGEDEWYAVDLMAGVVNIPEEENLPAKRQSLPERRREPWPMGEVKPLENE